MIINPWTFYLISLFSTLKIIFIVLIILLILLGPLFLIFCDEITNYEYDDEGIKKIRKKTIKIVITSLILLSVGTVIVPDKKTCYMMLISSYVTSDNITIVKDEVIDIIEGIQERLDK